MSGAIKSVKKVFKKAVKTVKKVAPYALAAAAIYFTASSAMGDTLLGTNIDISNVFGLQEGLLKDTLGGAIQQASVGTLVGGALGAAGGDWKKGAVAGAGVGALTGAATGFVQSPNTMAGPSEVSGAGGQPSMVGGAGADQISAAPPVTLRDPMQDIPTTYIDSSGTSSGPQKGKLLSFWDEVKNSELASGVAGGIATGVGNALLAEDSRDYTDAARVSAEAAAQARRESWGGGDVGLLTTANNLVPSTGRPLPVERWDPQYVNQETV
jgi:hypothetical protein